MVWYFLLASTMLIVWLICTFGLVAKSITSPVNSTQAAITATTFTVDLDPSEGNLDLDNAETNEKNKLEIIKQIRRVNSDGSYTVGYEAVDGRFKIESRDVLGNVKGTYGYVDTNGEIKRVSYTANNSSNDMKSKSQPIEEVVHIPRLNKTGFAASTTRRPSSLSYLMTSTSSPTKMNANIMQAIPKRRILLASAAASHQPPNKPQYAFKKTEAFEHTEQTTPKSEPTPTVVYATSIRSTVEPHSTATTDDQISKSNNFDSAESLTTTINTKDKKTNTEQSDKISSQNERKPVRGNSLRRQLPSDQSENYETHQQIVYNQGSSDEESTHTYTGHTGTQRPIFTTTSSPRIPALVLAARSRAAQLKNAALHPTQTSSTTERAYTKQPRRNGDRRDNNESKIDPVNEHEFLTQGPETVQIPSSRDNQPVNEIKSHSHRHPNAYLPRNRDYLRQAPVLNIENNDSPVQYKFPTQVQQTYTQNLDGKQFLRETTDPNLKIATTTAISPEQYGNNDLNAATQPILQSYHPHGQQPYDPRHPSPRGEHEQPIQQQSIPLGLQPYQTPLPQQFYNNYPERPVTARDFERLLSLLVLRYQQQQRINLLPGLMNGNFFNGGVGGVGGFNGFGGNFGGYNPYSPFNYPAMRSPLYNQFDPRYTSFSRSLPPVPPPNSFYGPYSEQENMYQAQNPVEQHLPYMRRTMQPRRKFNNNQYYATNYDQPDYGDSTPKEIKESFLPPEVREELLYRMLMLAIQPDYGSQLAIPDASTMQEYFRSHSIPATTTTSTTPIPNSKKPVRSVQILGEE